MSRETPDSSSGGLQIQTLLLSAVSAVAAATLVPLFWEHGTVIATAMTPVIVALVTEALRRPVQRVSAVAPKVTAAAPRAAARRFSSSAPRARPAQHVGGSTRVREPLDPVAGDELRPSEDGVSEHDPFGLRASGPRRPWWRIGLVTGLLAFVLAAAVVTASELTIFGGSVSGQRGRTTIFGGHQKQSSGSDQKTPSRSATPDPQATAPPSRTPAPTTTATPTPTTTPAPTATPTPTTAGSAASPTPTP